MSEQHLIVSAIEQLREDLNSRFSETNRQIGIRFDGLDKRIDTVVTDSNNNQQDHENRVRKLEDTAARGRGILMALGTLIGAEGLVHAKAAWTSLMK